MIDRPKARNALSMATLLEMQEHIGVLERDGGRDAGIVVVESAGPVFSSGHDLKEMSSELTHREYHELFSLCSDVMARLAMLPQPVIAKVQGIATAAGCQLVSACDLAYAGESARFATPGVNIGLFCSTPAVALSRAVGRKHAMEMLLTGDFVDANEAQRIGLINRAVPDSELDSFVLDLARKIASKSPASLRIGKKVFSRQLRLPLTEAYQEASAAMADNMCTGDAKEGIRAFLEKRQPVWPRDWKE
eukprot:g1821.t1